MNYELDYALLGKRIKEERKRLNMTQEQLAEYIEISPAFVGHIERNERSLSLPTLIRIANRLGVTLDYLFADVITPKYDVYVEEFRQLTDQKSPKALQAILDIVRTLARHLK